jgi:hypothetical protein
MPISAAGFEQRHLDRRILAQTVRQNTSGSAPADDDEIAHKCSSADMEVIWEI